MKAIYINLDPYLQAVADWRKDNPPDDNTGEYPTPPPSFFPLPVAVTIPLGETAAIFVIGSSENSSAVFYPDGLEDGLLVSGSSDFSPPSPPSGESVVADDCGCPFSKFNNENAHYSVFSVSGDSANQEFFIFDGLNDGLITSFSIPVLVRRETASGPVDLVDFTPPAAAPTLTAAAINAALGGTGVEDDAPLAGVSLGGAILMTDKGVVYTQVAHSGTVDGLDFGVGSLDKALGCTTAS